MLAIEVRWLEPSYEAALDTGAEWPPHPWRLFAALTAAASGQADDDALRWLEQQGPPSVHAPPAVSANTLTAFVPTNKIEGATKSNRVARKNLERQWHRTHLAGDRVRMEWDADCPPTVRSALSDLSRRVGYLGRSTSQVVLSVTDAATQAPDDLSVHLPDPTGASRLRVPTDGTLEALRQAFDAGSPARTASNWAFYRGPDDPPVPKDDAEELDGPYPHLLTLSFPAGEAVDGRMAVRVAVAFRSALLQRLGQDFSPDELSLLHGHRPADDPRRQCAVLPLPFVGFEHASGQIHGVGLALSPDLGADVRRELLRACQRSLDHDGLTSFTIPGLGPRDLIDPGRMARAAFTVQADRWVRGSTVWTTAYPIVLDRYPKRVEQVPAQVAEGCVMAGLPHPVEVEHLAAPAPAGVQWLRRGDLKRRRRDPNRPAVHVRITFDRPVRGPVVVGNMRHLGLGLCVPEKGPEQGSEGAT